MDSLISLKARRTQAILMEGVSYAFGRNQALQKIDLELKSGSLTALVGPNGAGKSTLLQLIQGRLRASEGSIKRNGSIAIMPQRASVDWSFPINVAQMVNLGRFSFKPMTKSRLTTGQVIDIVGMQGMESCRLSCLSGGQQQRVLFARALMQQTNILLLDEPFSAIDPPSREYLLTIIRQQVNVGKTICVSSHDWGNALNCYDKVVVIDRRVLSIGSPDEVRKDLSNMTCMKGDLCCD